jgi:hypothetical protein
MGRVTHRAISAAPAGALLTLGVVLLGAPAARAAPEPPPLTAVLGVSPTHGRPAAPFTATFRVFPGPAAQCPRRATFVWDGRPLGEADFGPACTAVRQFVPPENDRTPGIHGVTATAGADGRRAAASAAYTVEPGTGTSPSVPPSSGPPKTTAPTSAAPTPSRTRPSPTIGASQSEDAVILPEVSEEPTVGVDGTRAIPITPATTPWTAWALIGGGALVLVGAVTIGLLILSTRRARADDDADTDDAVAGADDSDKTQAYPLPVGRSPEPDTPTVEQPRPPVPEGG